jgi:iron complex outermembrane receptor protein
LNWRHLFFLLAFALPVIAQAAEPLSEEVYLGEMPMVLTASRIAQTPLDAPAPVTVIDRETIRASGFTEIHDLLRLVPGFLVADWPKGGPMVVNHGLGDALSIRLLVLVDGFSMLDAAFGYAHWQDLHIRLQDIERIEVVRGPNQASFGANAYQGVINIITRRAGEEVGGNLSLSLGERNYNDAYVRYGQNNESLDWRVSASSRQATNFRDLDREGYQYDERIRRQTLNAQAVYRLTGSSAWRANFGLSRGSDAVGSIAEGGEYPDHDRDNKNLFLQLSWHNFYAPGSEISVKYSHSNRSDDESFVFSYGGLSSPAYYDVDARRDELELQQIHAFSNSVQGVWGGSLRRDVVESDRYFYDLGKVDGTQWQVFGNLDWRLTPEWLLHAGGMLEKHYSTDTLFSPRVALNYALSPLQSLRVGAGRGYRAPTMFEAKGREAFVYRGVTWPGFLEYGDTVDLAAWVDGTVEPEKLDYVELGYVGRYPGIGLQVDARVFEEHHEGMITNWTCFVQPTSETPPCEFSPPANYVPIQQLFGAEDKAYLFVNGEKNRVRGVEVSLDWRHPQYGRFWFSHAITQIDSHFTDADTRRDAEQSAPLHATSLLWSNTFGAGMQASLGVYRLGDMKWMGNGDLQPAYTRVDLRLAKHLGHGGDDNQIALVVRNLNGNHTEFRPTSTVERQAFVTLSLDW